MRETRDAYRILIEKPDGGRSLGTLRLDGRVILK